MTYLPADLADKLVLVTGAASGQGRAAARMFADAGARLVLLDLNEDGLHQAAEELRLHGSTVHPIAVDVGDRHEVARLLAAIEADHGAFDVVYNNAGILLDGRGDGDIDELDWEALETTFRVNLFGVMGVCRAVIPAMAASGRGGSIINTSTLGALIGTRVHAYSASKGGVIAFTRSLAISYGQHRIRANVIAPGFIETDLSRNMLDNERYRARLEKTIPLGYIGRPEDVASVAVFLASDASRYLSGVVIPVDGALLAV